MSVPATKFQQGYSAVQKGADALSSDAGAVVGRAGARAGEMERGQGSKPLDVWRHSRDGYNQQIAALGNNPALKYRDIAEIARVVTNVKKGVEGLKKGLGGPRHSSSLSDVGTAEGQLLDRLGDDLGKIADAKGALQTFGAAVGALTTVEQMLSAPAAMIPFPAFPALRVGDYDIGVPHGHTHWPNVPPTPPLFLPSTGPVIPIPFVSGASQTLINGMPAARCGDLGLGIWCGGYVPLYEIFLGSASVWIEGSRAARMAIDVTNHCIFSARKGADDKPLGMFIGLTITGSSDVLIGGVPLPSLTNMAMGAAFKLVFKGAGRVIKALGKTKVGGALANKLRELGQKARDAWKNLGKKADDTIPDMHAAADQTMPGGASTSRMDTLDIFLREFSDEVRDLVRLSPTLSDQLRELHRRGWSARRGPDPSIARRGADELVIQEGPPMQEVGSLAHEGGHGLNPAPPDIPRQGLTEAEFVRQDVDNRMLDEGRAQFNEAKVLDEIRSNGGPDQPISGNHSEQYSDVYQDYKNGVIDEDRAIRDMGDIMRDDVTGNTNDLYRDYYADDAIRRYNQP